jgi:hypothetical protein
MMRDDVSPLSGWTYRQADELATWLASLGYGAYPTPLVSSRTDFGVLVTAPRSKTLPPTVIRGAADLWRLLPKYRPAVYKLTTGAN